MVWCGVLLESCAMAGTVMSTQISRLKVRALGSRLPIPSEKLCSNTWKVWASLVLSRLRTIGYIAETLRALLF